MTRKDYEKIAEVLRRSVERSRVHRHGPTPELWEGEGFAISSIVQGLCVVFQADNPRFDVDRFELAVYGQEVTA